MTNTCSDPFAFCACAEPADHDGDHVCDCGGSWTVDHEIVTWPEGRTRDEATAATLSDVYGPLLINQVMPTPSDSANITDVRYFVGGAEIFPDEIPEPKDGEFTVTWEPSGIFTISEPVENLTDLIEEDE